MMMWVKLKISYLGLALSKGVPPILIISKIMEKKLEKYLSQYHGLILSIVLNMSLLLLCHHVFDILDCSPRPKCIVYNINTFVFFNIVPCCIKNLSEPKDCLEVDLLPLENIKLEPFHKLNVKIRLFWTVNDSQSLFELTLVFAVFLSQINLMNIYVFRPFFFFEIEGMKSTRSNLWVEKLTFVIMLEVLLFFCCIALSYFYSFSCKNNGNNRRLFAYSGFVIFHWNEIFISRLNQPNGWISLETFVLWILLCSCHNI